MHNWDPDLTVDAWWRPWRPRVDGAALPARAGRAGTGRRSQAVVRAAFAAHGALRPPGGLGLLMAAPTILTHGTPEQIDRLVPPILDGRAAWCQLFSEPGAGSDLAGLTTRARRDGDRWIISGQKVWCSQAREADYGMLLARTSFDVPKHRGISWFAFALDQPGVTIRPLREMTGQAVFNEVFLDEAVCDDADLDRRRGQRLGGHPDHAALRAHRHRRRRSARRLPEPGPEGRHARAAGRRRRARRAAQRQADGRLPRRRRAGAKHGRHRRPGRPPGAGAPLRLHRDGRWNALRGKAEAQRGGGQAVASIGKLAPDPHHEAGGELGIDILGAHGLLAGDDGVEGGAFAEAFVFSPASSIYGGTDEIQRNIVAERSLGLPREPAPDRDRPYGDVLRDRNASSPRGSAET